MRRFLCVHITASIVVALCIAGCANDDDIRALGSHGLFLTKTHNTAFVARMSDHSELAFGDAELREALPFLQRLPQVKRRQLDGTSVTDASIAEVKSLSTLEELVVDETAVTAQGLLALKGMPRLHFLLVDEKRLSASDLEMLQRELTDVEVLVTKQPEGLHSIATRPRKYERVAP
jgi:hypothetical protein